ncbi:MAG: WD40 repeat domain-containing protein, partial [Gemmataceae bacterium]|nr:WD40 repeat domain-containing protein [Gemmataceae bacterium]
MACALAIILLGAGPPPRWTEQAFVEGCPQCFCVSRDGKRLALNSGSIWDIPGRKKLASREKLVPATVCFSPDGKYLAVAGSYSFFHVFNTSKDGKEHWNLTLKGHGDTVVQHQAVKGCARFPPPGGCVNGFWRGGRGPCVGWAARLSWAA